MARGLSADSGAWNNCACVVLRGAGCDLRLTESEARSLARWIDGRWSELTAELLDAAQTVDRQTGFDSPIGTRDEFESEPGNYERAREVIEAALPGR